MNLQARLIFFGAKEKMSFWYSIFFVFQTTEVPSTVKTEIKIECLDGNCNNNTPKDDNQKSKPRKGVEQKSSKKELDNPKIIDLHKSDDDGDHVKGRKGMNPGNFLGRFSIYRIKSPS